MRLADVALHLDCLECYLLVYQLVLLYLSFHLFIALVNILCYLLMSIIPPLLSLKPTSTILSMLPFFFICLALLCNASYETRALSYFSFSFCRRSLEGNKKKRRRARGGREEEMCTLARRTSESTKSWKGLATLFCSAVS